MEEPPECLTDSVDLGPEGCSVRGEDFEPCLPFKLYVREYTLELSDSVSNLSAFQCRLFLSVFDAPRRGVFRPRMFGRRYSSAARLFANSSLTPVHAFSSPASSLLAA